MTTENTNNITSNCVVPGCGDPAVTTVTVLLNSRISERLPVCRRHAAAAHAGKDVAPPTAPYRVGALMESNKDKVWLFGYGNYVGDVACPALADLPNPKIVLDSGKVVWGFECWWAAEKKMQSMIAGREVIEVDIDQERAKHRESEAQQLPEDPQPAKDPQDPQ